MDATGRVDAAREKLAREMRALVHDAEEMLAAASRQGGEQLSAVRERLEHSLSAAKAGLSDAEQAVLERARRTARETDEYVHDHPWTAVGIGAGIGLLLGLLIARR
ncbi:MAG: DUF883 family protein [Burkholderiaceae bacterium]|nr:DUF883 family protein [Burkholderiaceae bacterium]